MALMSSYFNDPVFSEMERMMDRSLDRAFAPFREGSHGRGIQSAGLHPMDVVETKDAYKVIADVPGFASDEVMVELNEGVLKVSGQRDKSSELKNEDGQVIKQERHFTKFSRSFALPKDAKHEGIRADLDKGVLTVTVPKVPEPPKPEPMRIPITSV